MIQRFSLKVLGAAIIVALSLLSLIPAASAQTKCRALILQGGGDKGAYEAGVFYGFINNARNSEDFQYDVVTGVSVGAINAACLAQYDKGQEVAVAERLVSLWQNVTQDQVFVSWPGGPLEGLFFKPSLYNNDPEITFLQNQAYLIPNKRKVTIVSTDANTGQKISFDENYWGQNTTTARNAILYSSSVPFIFSYRNEGSHTFIDGGWSGEGMDFEDAVSRCREIVDNDEDIIIDIIFAGNISFTNIQAENYTTMKILSRYRNIQNFVSQTRSLAYAKKDFPKVDFRYVIVASKKLPDQDVPLDFKADNIDFMIKLGMSDAIKALSEGPKAGWDRITEFAKKYKQ